MIHAWMFVILERQVGCNAKPAITYDPMFERDKERMNNLNHIYNNNDVESIQMSRMKRTPFNNMLNTFMIRLLKDNIHRCIDEQVAMFLHVLGYNQRFRMIHSTWR
jgi:hypothetical protein